MTSAKSSLPLSQKLFLYSLGAGAATVAASAHGAASDVVTTRYTGSTTSNAYFFNLQNTVAPNNGGSSTGEQFEFYKGNQKANATYVSSTNYVIATESKLGGPYGTTATNYVLKLGVGATIGAGTNFTTSGVFNNYYAGTYTNSGGASKKFPFDGSGAGDWRAGTTTTGRGFVGLRILTTGGQTDYGFADMTITSYTGGTGTFVLNGYAYDPTGAAITTFAIPEPGSTTALLVAGAAGAAALRRRKAKATSEA